MTSSERVDAGVAGILLLICYFGFKLSNGSREDGIEQQH
jgi:hypothetical protein